MDEGIGQAQVGGEVRRGRVRPDRDKPRRIVATPCTIPSGVPADATLGFRAASGRSWRFTTIGWIPLANSPGRVGAGGSPPTVARREAQDAGLRRSLADFANGIRPFLRPAFCS